MATNFDYLLAEQKFSAFADVAITAEKLILVDYASCAIATRRAMEFAVKWMYSVDKELEMPFDDKLNLLMGDYDFRKLVGENIYFRMEYIRKTGNTAVHSKKKISYDEALLCLENLSIFLDLVAYYYSDQYELHAFTTAYIDERKAKIKQNKIDAEDAKQTIASQQEDLLKSQAELEKRELDLKRLIAENESLRGELSKRRVEQQQTYVPKPLQLSEYKTRKIYIDSMLTDAGWTEGKDWINEVELPGMPNKSEVGYADYVLYDDMHRPLAIIEAKRTCVDVSKGRQQAKLYADILENKYHRRPVIFLTNGFETHIIDGQYPERECATIYSKRDLEKWFNLLTMRGSLKNIKVDSIIAGRYYQEAAIKAVCDSFGEKNKRKALLVMATGSGKTRTVIALCDVLLKAGWVKNILFLADRNSLVTQAKRSFVNMLPNLSCTNLVEEKDNYTAHCVFSTYQTMIHCIDDVSDSEGKLFTSGHFDLVICDEAHRSIYNKYQDIFTYFDAPLVGLTATPKDEIDKNTYDVFELGNGLPTYGYELAQAVKDGYLVDYVSIESKLKFIEQGIVYDDLSDEEKEEYERNFVNEDGELPDSINSGALNTWLFNVDTIKQVLNVLMTEGIRVDYGKNLGKTIIFAKNHQHAEEILKIFNKEYPHLPNYAKVIDNYLKYAQTAIDEFSEAKKMPQIAISVDMLDTGIDVPEVVNLVFFKKVMSKAKFWQMIGRGTRLCPGLLDGKDKEKFYIFDFCGNFDFFRLNQGSQTPNMISVSGAIFNLEFQIAYKLQSIEYQTDRLIAYRNSLVEIMTGKVKELNRDNFAVKQHLKYVDLYSNSDNYNGVSFEDTKLVGVELCPLILPDEDEGTALRFDALIYGLELAFLMGKKYNRARTDVYKKLKAVSKVANIPEVAAQMELISKILNTDYLDNCGIEDFEYIREQLRDIMKFIPKGHLIYETDFGDDLFEMNWNESELENDDLVNYKAKAEFYVRQNKDNIVIGKLRTNKPLTDVDIASLESILWSELGTREEYVAEYGDKPLGEFVREIVGLDMNAAKEAFASYLNDTSLDSRQIYFVNQIIEYIVHNGLMKDLSVLQDSPFTDQGSIVDIFTDLSVWSGIRKTIEAINANAVVG